MLNSFLRELSKDCKKVNKSLTPNLEVSNPIDSAVCGKRGSPIGFSGSGIWLISRPGFGILKEKGDEIRDCNYDRDTGFGDFNRRESGNIALKKARFVNSRD